MPFCRASFKALACCGSFPIRYVPNPSNRPRIGEGYAHGHTHTHEERGLEWGIGIALMSHLPILEMGIEDCVAFTLQKPGTAFVVVLALAANASGADNAEVDTMIDRKVARKWAVALM